jgi:hypothetical protein
MFTAFVLHTSLKKELKELQAIHAQKASFKPLSVGKHATLFFVVTRGGACKAALVRVVMVVMAAVVMVMVVMLVVREMVVKRT